jgi:phytoene desaturase
MRKAIIIGSGIGGLALACILGKKGYEVTVLEKNEQIGGRVSVFEAEGFRFDMGPSWYLMPDVFEHFFSLLGEDVHEYLQLQKLSPSYRIFFKDGRSDQKVVDIFSDLTKDVATVEALELGAGEKLKTYLAKAKIQYEIALNRFMYKNYSSLSDFFTREAMTEGRKLSVFQNMDRYVKKFFHTREMQQLMQYTLVFLGSSPYNTPALYSIMSHVDFAMGVYYPQKGIYTIPEALQTIAKKYGVEFRTHTPVKRIVTEGNMAVGVETAVGEFIQADVVISNADIHHTETVLLEKKHQSFSQRYWRSRVLSPSAFIMYLGVDGKIPTLTHHNLIFSSDWQKNFGEIFDTPKWPTDPSLYVCAPSVTDPSVAPEGKENLFVLVPIAPRLTYTDADLDRYADAVLQTMETEMKIPNLRKRIVYKKYFCVKDFSERYNSFGGSALGLAHTLTQTAIFRPDTKSKKVDNLFYVGAGTNPGIGMPVCLISAELAYKRMIGDHSAGPLETL